MEADHVLQYGPRVPGIAGRQTIPFTVRGANGVTEPPAYRHMELAHTRITSQPSCPGDVEPILCSIANPGGAKIGAERRGPTT
jgi:hypothetical protein